jgi:hypothetical protein
MITTYRDAGLVGRPYARWARRPIDVVVISFDDVPRIDDAQAQRLPELAVLSAMAHADLQSAETAVAAISALPEDLKQLYLDVILANLPDVARRTLEARVLKGYQYQSAFARRYYNEGHETGRAKGLHDAVLALARGRLAELTAEEVTAIEALRDEHVLTDLIAALGNVNAPSEIRAAFMRVLQDSANHSASALDPTGGG